MKDIEIVSLPAAIAAKTLASPLANKRFMPAVDLPTPPDAVQTAGRPAGAVADNPHRVRVENPTMRPVRLVDVQPLYRSFLVKIAQSIAPTASKPNVLLAAPAVKATVVEAEVVAIAAAVAEVVAAATVDVVDAVENAVTTVATTVIHTGNR